MVQRKKEKYKQGEVTTHRKKEKQKERKTEKYNLEAAFRAMAVSNKI